MDFLCSKQNLMKGITSVIKGIPSRTTMPILEGILIKTDTNQIILTTYDLEIGIEYILEGTVKTNGAIVVNAFMFSEIIRKLPDSEIKITLAENNVLVIDCEGALYKLTTMNPDEFPELPKINVENHMEMKQKILKNMIRKTIFAVSQEENRPIFTGCLFEIMSNELNIVAVDGFRLAWKTIKLEKETNNFRIVIPGKSLSEVNKILSDTEDIIKIGIEKNQVLFEMENCKIVTRLLEGEFLNYQSVIPSSFETKIRINKNNLLAAFERIILISTSSVEKEKKYPVKVLIDIGKMTILCTNQVGYAKEEIYAATEGKNLEIGFNPKYFLDVLKTVEEEEVIIEFGTEISPCIITSAEKKENFTYMILPIMLKES